MHKMLKTTFLILALALFLIPALVMAGADKEKLPQTESKDFIHYIAKPYYRGWPMWPGKDMFYQGTEPHGALLTTYVNQVALKAIEEGKQTEGMPDGSIIVKENYTPDKKLAAVTAMYKKKGYNPQAGDWYWIKFAPKEGIQASGKVESCINCHEGAKGDDYLFTAGQSK